MLNTAISIDVLNRHFLFLSPAKWPLMKSFPQLPLSVHLYLLENGSFHWTGERGGGGGRGREGTQDAESFYCEATKAGMGLHDKGEIIYP